MTRLTALDISKAVYNIAKEPTLPQLPSGLTTHFYGDNGRRERSFVTENRLQGCFGRALVQLAGFPPWSAERFGALRQRVIARAGSLEVLWQEFGADGGGE